ncbi:MAG: hypothetical protein ABL995_18405 [Bryobacteraceae bacterium]
MNTKVKVVHEGETVDAEEMPFRVPVESAMVCEIEDGTRVEIKHWIKHVYRLCDKKKDDGTPIYLMTGGADVKQIQPGGTAKSGENQ